MRWNMKLLLVSLVGYLIGSIPFAYVIGKVFYQTDVRQHGSGNLGGSNTGRVLGAKAGLAVMALDMLKVTLSAYLAARISGHLWALSLAALAAAVGHCYPIFARFRGGKAVAAFYGYLFALWVCAEHSHTVFLLPFCTFLIVLAVSRIVSLSSILSSAAAVLYLWLSGAHAIVILDAAIISGLIIVRHSGNIQRMRSGTERKIQWL